VVRSVSAGVLLVLAAEVEMLAAEDKEEPV
jgi:hypothetical protein